MIAFLPGLATSLGLIVAIGAQNAFVIRQSLTRKHVLLVVLICAASDALLIALGIAGLGAAIQGLPWLLEVFRWFGAAYLTWFGVSSLRSALRDESMVAASGPSESRKKVVLALLGFTFLNPHCYLDTVILLGSIGNQFGDQKWLYALGAACGSFLWFATIGFGARAASGLMTRPLFWKILDVAIAAIMFTIAGWLAVAGI